MATAQTINYSPLSLTAGSVAMTGQDSLSKKSKGTSSDATSSNSSKSRIVSLTSAAPTLIKKSEDKKLSDLNNLLTSSLNLLEKAEKNKGDTKELTQQVKVLFSKLSALVSKDFPKAKEAFETLTNTFTDMIENGPSKTDSNKVIQDIQSALPQLKSFVDTELSAPLAASAKPVIDSLSKTVESKDSTDETKTDEAKTASTTDDEKAKESLVQALIMMIRLVQALEAAVAQNQGTESKITSALGDKLSKVMAAMNEESLKKCEDLNEKIQAAKHASFWQKIGMDILGAILVVVVSLVAGPIAGMIAATLFVMQATGVTNKMFSAIHSPIGRFFAELGFALAVGLAGGGLQALAESASSMAVVGGEVTAKAGADAISDGVEIEMGSLGRSLAEEEGGEELDNVASKEGSSAAKSASSKVGQVAFGAGSQALLNTSAMMDLAEAIMDDPKGKKDATKWLGFALSLIAAIASAGVSMKMNSSSLISSVEGASESGSKLTAALKMLPKILSALGLGAAGFSGWFGYKAGEAKQDQASIVKDQGPIAAMIAMLKQLNSFNLSSAQSATQMTQQSLGMLQASSTGWATLAEPGTVAAQVLA